MTTQFETIKVQGHKAVRYFGSPMTAVKVGKNWQVYEDATAEVLVCVLRAHEMHGWMFRASRNTDDEAVFAAEDEIETAPEVVEVDDRQMNLF